MLPKFAPNKEVGEIATPTSSQQLSPELAWNPDKITSRQSRWQIIIKVTHIGG